ncbi:MAG TPA: hypothetical protein VL944_02820 [Candidatus Acidoferrum sp.]|nr:hypothetical protein [Candidatus Acidoferrum sp.]
MVHRAEKVALKNFHLVDQAVTVAKELGTFAPVTKKVIESDISNGGEMAVPTEVTKVVTPKWTYTGQGLSIEVTEPLLSRTIRITDGPSSKEGNVLFEWSKFRGIREVNFGVLPGGTMSWVHVLHDLHDTAKTAQLARLRREAEAPEPILN